MKTVKRALVVLGAVAAALPSTVDGYLNVYGEDLQSCSSASMALTGYTRNGKCTNLQDDAGSHHICINLSSTSGGNFCSVTGQPNWCASDMPCHQDQQLQCPVQNWCVCQWAFASYIEKAGGCDQIKDVVCEAVNMEAVNAYRRSTEVKHMEALKCLESRCNLISDQ